MSGEAKHVLCVLWESELRKAARLVARFYALPENATQDEMGVAANDALAACWAALYHVTDDKALVLTAAPKPTRWVRVGLEDGK